MPNGDEIPQGIFLGDPFDQLFDQKCPWAPDRSNARRPAIKIPRNGSAGTGNIIITGLPGTAKSTLAMQFAVSCVQHPLNHRKWISAYLALEQSPTQVSAKADSYGWKDFFWELRHLHNVSPGAHPTELDTILERILTQPLTCPIKKKSKRLCTAPHNGASTNRVLLSSLSPRPLRSITPGGTLFQERYDQVERLLEAAQKYNRKLGENGKPQLRLVCVDSLNMFGAKEFDREEIYRLFRLFSKYEIIGVFVVETSHETWFDSTMADVVINLRAEKDRSYFVRYLEIVKSRYFPQVYGEHLFKTKGC